VANGKTDGGVRRVEGELLGHRDLLVAEFNLQSFCQWN
jgi:hypothetical protein